MRPSFLPRLVNGPFADPGLYVPLTFRKRALLFDIGDLSALSSTDILKTSHVFVSHTHMDHFIGFDQMLRLLLGRDKTLHVYGPAGFLDNITGKLQAYTWNLVQNYQEGLMLHATEILPHKCLSQSFDCRKGFAPSERNEENIQDGVVHQEPALMVRTAILDHLVPSLAFSVKERFHINILRAELDALGLAVGPWVSEFKNQIYQKADPDTPLNLPCSEKCVNHSGYTLGELAEKITRITPGQKIAYVADSAFSPENQNKIIELAREADHLYIEAAFLDKDHQTAQAKYHLTAHQAGTLANRAKVREMTIFHHSPRYLDQENLLKQEAKKAFKGSTE